MPCCAVVMPAVSVCGLQSDIPVYLFKLKRGFVVKSPAKAPTVFSRPAKLVA